MPLEEAIWVDPARMSGTPCFRDTRVPARQLIDWLLDGESFNDFIEDFHIRPEAASTVLIKVLLAGLERVDLSGADLTTAVLRAGCLAVLDNGNPDNDATG